MEDLPNSSSVDLPPQPSWEDIMSRASKEIDDIKGKMYNLDIRKKARLNDLRGLYPKMKEKYGDYERWDEMHQMFKLAQTDLEKA